MQNNLIDVKPSQSIYFGFINLRLYMKYKLETEKCMQTTNIRHFEMYFYGKYKSNNFDHGNLLTFGILMPYKKIK